jgi:Aspartyl/Asparaginyl beta-hydroxylase
MSVATKRLPFQFDVARLQQDAALFAPAEWIPHFNQHYYEGDWSGVALRAARGAQTTLFPDPEAKLGFDDTAHMSRTRYVSEVLQQLRCEFTTVRLLKLAAGSVIRRHRDYLLSPDDGEVRLHVPVVTSDQVEFMLDDKRVMMAEGELWFLNFNLYHSVNNRGSADRIHLVIDCVMNDWLRDLLREKAA